MAKFTVYDRIVWRWACTAASNACLRILSYASQRGLTLDELLALLRSESVRYATLAERGLDDGGVP